MEEEGTLAGGHTQIGGVQERCTFAGTVGNGAGKVQGTTDVDRKGAGKVQVTTDRSRKGAGYWALTSGRCAGAHFRLLII